MNNELMVKRLKNAGVLFASGLCDEECCHIEEVFGFRFPAEIRTFFASALPVSHGFYNWRDQSGVTMQQFREFQENMKDAFLFDIEHSKLNLQMMLGGPFVDMTDTEELKESIFAYVGKSTKLIPFCRHRCFFDGMDDMPIVSFWQPVDTIFYGENLEKYLENEFLGMEHCIGQTNERMKDTGIWYHLIR